MSLHVGTSGWAYKEWKPDFYPSDLAQANFLEYYAAQLGACEINATHYRLQPEHVVARWAAATPPDFRFTVKAHRRLSHGRAMAWDEPALAFLETFLASLAPLGDRFGALLLQYPPNRQRDDVALSAVLDALPSEVPVAIEFRHESWFDELVFQRIADAGGTICIAETSGAVLDRLPAGPFAYVRLRADHYDADARDGWLTLLRREAAARPVYVLTKHEGVPAGNPFAGVGLAQWLVAASPDGNG